MSEDKKLARNSTLMIAAESLKQMYDELTGAGFTEKQAIDYMSSLVAKTSWLKGRFKEKNDEKRKA